MSEQPTQEYRWISSKSLDYYDPELGVRREIVQGDIVKLTAHQAANLKGFVKHLAVEALEAQMQDALSELGNETPTEGEGEGEGEGETEEQTEGQTETEEGVASPKRRRG